MMLWPRYKQNFLSLSVVSASMLLALIISLSAGMVRSQTTGNGPAEEKEECTSNLKQIYSAIQHYQKDKKDLPNWLSDLVPEYLTNVNLLVCPVCRRTGKTESSNLADPKIATSYLFEFCPVPLGKAAPTAQTRTRRDWKRLQMGLVGSIVPIVRCRHHDPVLNVAFDGTIYESPSMWESVVTNRVNPAELTAARLFSREPSPAPRPENTPPPQHFAPRDPKTPKAALDLTDFYNAMLTESWHGSRGNDLSSLAAGLQKLGGVQFDVRGIVQLGSKSPSATKFPSQARGIEVHQKCQRIQFLHAAGFGTAADEGKQVASCIVHFATNQVRLEIPIIYGPDIRNWHALAEEPAAPESLKVAWTGQNSVSKSSNNKIRLFLTTWTNLIPTAEIESVDYVSSMASPAPFLIAITVE
jgi:hypothetical protein